ncbi:MAG: hypothetical protein ACYDCK_11865 [Thermoplasmatota archaeon]
MPAIPLALGWGGGSAAEPSTKEDKSPAGATAMWGFANDGKTKPMAERIYFDGIALHSAGTALNALVQQFDPNVDGGRTLSPVQTTFMAFLGYWRDCNGDGFIGDHLAPAAGATLAQYPTALLDSAGATRCPRGSPYNDGTLVDEFRWIGPDAAPNAQNANGNNCVGNPLAPNGPGVVTGCHQDINDISDCAGDTSTQAGIHSCQDTSAAEGPHSKVWSDWGRASEQPLPSLLLLPLQRGALDDSDGTLGYADAFTVGTLSATVNGAAGAGTWQNKPCIGNAGSPTSPGRTTPCLAPQTVYPPFQVKRLYNDSNADNQRGTDMVMVWDYNQNSNGGGTNGCNSAENNVGGLGIVGTPGLNPRVDPTFTSDPANKGSIDPTVADNTRPDFVIQGDQSPGDCGTNDGIHPDPFQSLEAGNYGQSGAGTPKFQADTNFRFFSDQRTDLLLPAGLPANMPYQQAPGSSAAFKAGGGYQGPGWYGSSTWLMSRREPTVHVDFVTFYAALTPEAISNNTYAGNTAATALPAGVLGSHIYGSENCVNGFGPGVISPNGWWNCDASQWATPDKLDKRTEALVGARYDLRDVDCYDDSVAPGAPAISADSVTNPARLCANDQ